MNKDIQTNSNKILKNTHALNNIYLKNQKKPENNSNSIFTNVILSNRLYGEHESYSNNNKNNEDLMDKLTVLKRSVNKYSEEAKNKLKNYYLKKQIYQSNNDNNKNKLNIVIKRDTSPIMMSKPLNNILNKVSKNNPKVYRTLSINNENNINIKPVNNIKLPTQNKKLIKNVSLEKININNTTLHIKKLSMPKINTNREMMESERKLPSHINYRTNNNSKSRNKQIVKSQSTYNMEFFTKSINNLSIVGNNPNLYKSKGIIVLY
jgi:hypothetical protein